MSSPDGPHEPGVAVIKLLFAHNGRCCAFFKPDGRRCDTLVVHPSWSRTKGEIVHIKADKPGGPRYDPRQSNAERHGYENLMVMCPDHHRFVDWLRPQDYSEQMLYDMKARVESETDRDGAVVWTHGDALLEAIARSAIIGYRISLGDYGEAGETIASITDRLNTRHTTGTLSFGGVAAAASGASGNLTVAHEDRALAEDGAVASATVRQEATVSPAPIQLAVEMPQPNAQAVDLEPAVLHLQGVPLDPQTTSADPSDTSTPGTSVNAHAGVAEASGAAGVATIHTTAEHSDDEPPEP